MISVKAELARVNYKYGEVARKMGMSPQNFGQKLKTNRFTLEEAEKVMALIGKKVVLVDAVAS